MATTNLDLQDIDIERIGVNLLMRAIEGGDLNMVKLLMEAGVHSQLGDPYRYSHVHHAVKKGHLEIVKYFHSMGASIKILDKSGTTPIWRAAYFGDLPMVEYLASQGASIHTPKGWMGYFPLNAAVANAHVEVVRFLIERGADVNKKSEPSGTRARKSNLEIAWHEMREGSNRAMSDEWDNDKIPRYGEIILMLQDAGAKEVTNPSFISKPGNYQIALGGSVTFVCEIDNVGDNTVIWSKDKRIITCGRYIYEHGMRFSLDRFNLSLEEVALTDAGEYICEVQTYNSKPIRQISQLQVLVPPELIDQTLMHQLVSDTLGAMYRIWIEKIGYVSVLPCPWPNGDAKPECLKKLGEITWNHTQPIYIYTYRKDVGHMLLLSLLYAMRMYKDEHLEATTIALVIQNCLSIKVDAYLGLLANDRNESLNRKISLFLYINAGQYIESRSRALMTPEPLDFLFGNLNPGIDSEIMLYSLLALAYLGNESQPEWQREMINQRFSEFSPSQHPLVQTEKKTIDPDNWMGQQLAFCAQWLLDNLWGNDDLDGARTRRMTNSTNINAKMIASDASLLEHLKIGPTGLEVRCDVAYQFHTVMSTVSVDEGCWYYEVTILTGGLMQIGWASKQANFLEKRGYGVGDDEFGESCDGCRRVLWYNSDQPVWWESRMKKWKPGDVVGALIDIENQEIVFTVNGVVATEEPLKELFGKVTDGFMAATSLMTFQHCRFNLGNVPFKHAPEGRSFKGLNEANFKS